MGGPQQQSKAPSVLLTILRLGRQPPAPHLQQQLQQGPAGHTARTATELQLAALASPLLFQWAVQLRSSAPGQMPGMASTATLPLRQRVRHKWGQSVARKDVWVLGLRP